MSALGWWVGKDKMPNSCWMMFTSIAMAFNIQISPKLCAEAKRIYNQALFVDNNKDE